MCFCYYIIIYMIVLDENGKNMMTIFDSRYHISLTHVPYQTIPDILTPQYLDDTLL